MQLVRTSGVMLMRTSLMLQVLMRTSGVTDVDAVAGHDAIVDRGSDRKCCLPVR